MLLRRADTALYRAKTGGRGPHRGRRRLSGTRADARHPW